MANITFLIGNGFDLGLGLKTSYNDFYQSLKTDSKNDVINSIRNDRNLWADMEVGLGRILSTYTTKTIDNYLNDLTQIEDLLSDYLEKQNNRFHIEDEAKVSESLLKKIPSIGSLLPQKYERIYSGLIKNTNEPIQYSFICFNYTNTLDLMLKSLTEKPSFSSHSFRGGTAGDRIVMPLHIHGKLRDGMIVGVNDESQINNPELRNNNLLLDSLVKTRTNTYFGNFNTQEARDLIDNSKVVYVYGLSMGPTDKIWTETLIGWLNASPNRLLIIDSHDKKYSRSSGSRFVTWRESTLSNIKSANGIEDQVFENVKDRICTIANTGLFSRKSIEGISISE